VVLRRRARLPDESFEPDDLDLADDTASAAAPARPAP
jgi:hypothetical protein